jgi:hypothetical protein
MTRFHKFNSANKQLNSTQCCLHCSAQCDCRVVLDCLDTGDQVALQIEAQQSDPLKQPLIMRKSTTRTAAVDASGSTRILSHTAADSDSGNDSCHRRPAATSHCVARTPSPPYTMGCCSKSEIEKRMVVLRIKLAERSGCASD